jgi:hypothetical protein
MEKFKNLRGSLSADPDDFESMNVWQDRELETLFGRYLNAKYRRHLIDGDSPERALIL